MLFYFKTSKLFQRSLIKVLNIDLWKCYLNYVRDIKSKMNNYKYTFKKDFCRLKPIANVSIS